MSGKIPVRWRTGLSTTMISQHQPLWSWLGANPVANRPRYLVGPIAGLVLWLVGLCSLCWMMLWIQKPKSVVMLQFVAGYQTNLAVPQNVAGVRCADQILALKDGILNSRQIEIAPPMVLRKETDISKAISEKSHAPLLILNFCMHGGYDDKGSFLIPDDADSSAGPKNRLRVDSLLAMLKKQPDSQVKMVIFDADQNDSLWSFGILDNQFSLGLAELDAQIRAIPNLIVVASSKQNEHAWINQYQGVTNFGNHLVRCLSGAGRDFNLDGQIDLGEVLRNLKREVDSWARFNRNAEQTVLILPDENEAYALLFPAVVGQAGKTPTDPAPLKPVDSLSELREVWEHYATLQSSTMLPEQLCPDLWEVYKKSILRYEALLRLNDVGNALTMRELLRQTESRIQISMQLSLNASGNSFSAGLVAGQDGTVEAEVVALATELLTSRERDIQGKLGAFIAKSPPEDPKKIPLKLRLQMAIMGQAAKSPDPNPDQLALLLNQLDTPGRIRPVESHGLLLYLRDRPLSSVSRAATLPQWIKTRLIAEQAACGITESGQWTQSSERGVGFQFQELAKADEVRQKGQDLLLSTDPANQDKGLKMLVESESIYYSLAEASFQTTRSLNLHNHLMSAMPDLTLWISTLSSPISPGAAELASVLEKKAISAWSHLHDAIDCKLLFAQALVNGKDYSQAQSDFSAHIEAADLAYREILDAYKQQCDSVIAASIFGQDQLIDNVLLVPDTNITLRMKILETHFSGNSLEKKEDANPGLNLMKNQMRAFTENIARSGKLAMAIVGKKIFDDKNIFSTGNLETFDETQALLNNFALQTDGGGAFLTRAGIQVGKRFERFESAAEDLLALADRSDSQTSLTLLMRADHLSRVGAFGTFARSDKPEAGTRLRRYWVNLFSINQARRSWTEHLYNLDKDPTPYYQAAMKLSILDASSGPAPLGLPDLLGLVSKNGDLRLDRLHVSEAGDRAVAKDSYAWTTEKSIRLELQVGPTEGGLLPPGHVQLEVKPGPEVLRPSEKIHARQNIDLLPAPPESGGVRRNSTLVNLESPLVQRGQDPGAAIQPGKIVSPLVVSAIFRGQRVPLVVPINLYSTPPSVQATLATGGPVTIAIRATPDALAQSSQANGNVALVVDCSGSMGPTMEGPGKIVEVATALEAVVSKLPPGVNLSVWIFGQATGPARTTDHPEDSIQLLNGPSILGPEPAKVAKRLADRFRSGEIIPWNKSPLLAAMTKASQALIGTGAQPGPSTLLVLTDGRDNRAIDDKSLNPGKLAIPSLVVKLFAGTGVQVRVIGFRAGDEDDLARADFEPLGKLNPPGSYSSAADLGQLIAQMERSLRREFRYQLETPSNLALSTQPPEGFEASLTGFTDRWILPGFAAGEYMLRSGSLRAPLGTLRLEPADCLLLGISKDHPARRLGMVDEMKLRPVARSSGWSGGIAQNKQEGQAVRMFCILEKDWDTREVELSQVKPGEVWWESSPASASLAPIRIWSESGYPSPAWTIFSPKWPTSSQSGGPVESSLRVWWSPEKIRSTEKELTQKADFKKVTDLANQSFLIDNKDCLLESVRLEDRLVTIEPGKVAIRKALVVRSRTAPPAPGEDTKGLALASLDGYPVEGIEQLVNADAGTVTSVFWPINEQTVQTIEAIQFRSLKKFKDESKARGYFLEFTKTGIVDPVDERPRRVQPFHPPRQTAPAGVPVRQSSP